MIVLLIVLVVALIAAFTGLYLWTRHMESDVDYSQLHADKTDQRLRNTAQLGIGLSSTQGNSFGN